MFPGLPKDYMWTENLDHRIYALSHCHCMYPVVMQIPYNYSVCCTCRVQLQHNKVVMPCQVYTLMHANNKLLHSCVVFCFCEELHTKISVIFHFEYKYTQFSDQRRTAGWACSRTPATGYVQHLQVCTMCTYIYSLQEISRYWHLQQDMSNLVGMIPITLILSVTHSSYFVPGHFSGSTDTPSIHYRAFIVLHKRHHTHQ